MSNRCIYHDFEDLNTGSSDCEDHFYIVAQRLLDAIRKVEAKLDAMEHRLLPPGCLYIPKPEITPAGQTANVCIADPFHVAETHLEGKP